VENAMDRFGKAASYFGGLYRGIGCPQSTDTAVGPIVSDGRRS
jgi:hypothetical protein